MPRLLTQLHNAILQKVRLTDQLDVLHRDLIYLEELSKQGDLDVMLDQSHKSIRQKALYLEKVIDGVQAPELERGLRLLVRHGEIDLFASKYFLDFLVQLQRELEKRTIVNLKVAVEFQPADIRRMADTLTRKLGKPVIFHLEVERGLLGGAIIQIGSHIYDYSLKSRMDQFRAEWEETLETPDHHV
jgi:F0F1-type ATP synthase delta subunit